LLLPPGQLGGRPVAVGAFDGRGAVSGQFLEHRPRMRGGHVVAVDEDRDARVVVGGGGMIRHALTLLVGQTRPGGVWPAAVPTPPPRFLEWAVHGSSDRAFSTKGSATSTRSSTCTGPVRSARRWSGSAWRTAWTPTGSCRPGNCPPARSSCPTTA